MGRPKGSTNSIVKPVAKATTPVKPIVAMVPIEVIVAQDVPKGKRTKIDILPDYKAGDLVPQSWIDLRTEMGFDMKQWFD